MSKDTAVPETTSRFGRYEIQQEIGEGAMGRVFKAWDPLVRRVVAIKTIRSEYLTHETSQEYLRRFRREAQAAGRLSHPNIVSIYDVGEDYFVMEFLEGVSLQAILAHRAVLPLAEALRILTPVAEAIDYAHHAGVVHRDVKPANIMIQPDGRPKLMDFGVARLPTSAITDSGQSFGSPSYMAPELIASDEVTPQADLFSFGVVAYEALTGKRPFQGESITAIIYRIVHEPAPPPRSYNDELPAHHDEVFRRALAKEPANRFPSAQSLIAALSGEELILPEELLEPLGARPRQEVSGELTTHLLKRRPDGTIDEDETPSRRWLSWAVMAAALLVVGAEVVALRKGGPVPGALLRQVPAAPEGLRIETRPAGASVWMDGRAAGETPLSIKDLRPGMHQLRLSLEGHAPAELTFQVQEGTTGLPLSFNMPPLLAPAEIRSEPPAATVSVDNKVIGLTPIEKLSLNPGAHEIRIERAGFVTSVKQVEARPGVKLLVQTRLAPAPPDLVPAPAASPAAAPLTEGMLVELDPSVTPPRRVSGDRALYPKDARRLHLQGTVEVEMIVDENGVPHDVHVLRGASALLDEAVIEAVYRFRYEPAVKDGVRVKARHTYSQTFP
ncbi:MAG TPA: TonB family protein [Vicinamibacteria bacterium]